MKPLTIFFVLLVACILTHSNLSLTYAGKGLDLWFYKMIPTLLPFMILSGTMVRLQLTEKVALLVHPILSPFYKVRKNVSYGMLMGFLCGFPMGARVASDLYTRQMISRREAEFLLAFCNNIGPVYFCSFVLPLLERKLIWPYVFGMYGIPLLYGLVLRHTFFKDLKPALRYNSLPSTFASQTELHCCQLTAMSPYDGTQNADRVALPNGSNGENAGSALIYKKVLESLDGAIKSAMDNIFMLGGYMILFNLLNLLPHIVLGRQSKLLSPILEITGGLSVLGASLPLYSLLVLSFGGLSCLAQTYSCISETDLNFGNYCIHKIILTLLNGLFYLGWFWFSPESFLL